MQFQGMEDKEQFSPKWTLRIGFRLSGMMAGAVPGSRLTSPAGV